MGGHEARAFMKWVVGAPPNSTIKRDKETGKVFIERPKSHHSSSKSHSSSSSHTPMSYYSASSSSYHSISTYSGPPEGHDYSSTVSPDDSVSQVSSRKKK
ncbi:hypothetical protein HD806DRAFT_531759 [Xylariaceae sp. AK1471]|nr:hypothetical protein HD806DRAFT_531759 [Xylariaceae sp. AK1471]